MTQDTSTPVLPPNASTAAERDAPALAFADADGARRWAKSLMVTGVGPLYQAIHGQLRAVSKAAFTPRERVHEHQLLADIEPALEELGLDAMQLGVPFEQRLQTGGILFPKRVPERDGLVGSFELALRGGLRLARESSRQFGMQVRNLFTHDFGDRRTLTGQERRIGHRLQLTVDGLV